MPFDEYIGTETLTGCDIVRSSPLTQAQNTQKHGPTKDSISIDPTSGLNTNFEIPVDIKVHHGDDRSPTNGSLQVRIKNFLPDLKMLKNITLRYST